MPAVVPPSREAVSALRHTTIQRFLEFRKVAPDSAGEPAVVEHIVGADTMLLGLDLGTHPEIAKMILLRSPPDAAPHEMARLSLVVANYMMAKSAAAVLNRQIRQMTDHNISLDVDQTRGSIAIWAAAAIETKTLADRLENCGFADEALFSQLMTQWPSLLGYINTIRSNYPILPARVASASRGVEETIIAIFFGAGLVLLLILMMLLLG